VNSELNDQTDFDQELQSNARIGARVKVSETLSARFEYGAADGDATIRLLYGTWNFGAGTLTIGQDYTPLNWFYSNQVFNADNDLFGHGGVYGGRHAQIRLNIGGFSIAVIAPDDTWDSYNYYLTQAETKIPKIMAEYRTRIDALELRIGGGYNAFTMVDTYDVVYFNGNAREYDVDAYVMALGGRLKLGRAYFAANAYIGRNVGNLLTIDTDGDGAWEEGSAYYDWNNYGFYNSNAKGGIVVAGYKLNDHLTFEAGYGVVETELNDSSFDEDTAVSYYAQAAITLAPGVIFTPEIGAIDGESDTDEKLTYIGAKWQVNF
jgi:hypothetical protein